eukprot:Gregarina_sp_Pseudo_9__940@NODE_15_length_6304_cov_17_343815_g13_i0_p3_GENE_NODE_15_length_6304_cov_17_343815_g13_i0NODE_15_length_6304_cov_17_343815_g13_i0_p3_ORF_typecomplete_len431_score124_96PIGX/PF08320_12/6_4e13_NODE_15_length_6304_cov_17_343815_g13_i026153907
MFVFCWVLLLWQQLAALELDCSRSQGGAVSLHSVSVLGPASLPLNSLETRAPFHFELDVANARVSLLAPAPPPAIQRFTQLAPSQFQANWRRSGGVIDGGDNAHLWVYELLPAWGLRSLLPPVPLYIETKYLLEQQHHHLPHYFGTFSLQDLRSLKVPLWEVYSANFPSLDAAALRTQLNASAHDSALSPFLQRHASLQPRVVSLEFTGVSSFAILHVEWEGDGVSDLCPEPVKAIYYEAELMSRSVTNTGLTNRLETTFSFTREIPEDCEVFLHEFWPSSTFVDSEELKAVHQCADKTEEETARASALIFPHFSEIELPAHLAAPTMMIVGWKGGSHANYTTCPLLFHTRYHLPVSPRGFDSQFELPPPRLSVKCFGIVNSVHLTSKIDKPQIPKLVVTREHLGLVSRVTTIFCGVAVLTMAAMLGRPK